ncbi:MAG: hypothetical protein ABI321_02000 [Polyangia bacterium]
MRALHFCQLMLGALVLAACSPPASITACSVDKLASADVSLVNYADCGTFDRGSPNYTNEAMTAAQLCVLNAVSRSQAFYLAYDATPDGSNTELRGAYSGVPNAAGDTLTIQSYAGRGTVGASSLKLVSERSCVTLTAADLCSPAVGVPCLTCTSNDAGSIQCRH